MPFFDIFEQKCRILVFFGNNIKESIVIFEISIHFSICKISREKQKWLNLEPKMPDLGIFGLEFENNIVIFEISAPSNLCNCKISRKKQKCRNLRPKMPYSVLLTKNVLFGYFWIRIFKKIIVIFEISTLKFV